MESSTYSKWWLPIDISVHGPDIDRLITVLHIFMFVLFVGWGIFFIYCLMKFRAGAGRKAQYVEVSGGISKAIEVAVVGIEVALLLFFSAPIWNRVKAEFPKEDEAQQVRIIAQQFQWNFHYPGKDGIFGKTKATLIGSDNMLGLDPSDPHGKDDITAVNNFRFPAGKPVIATLTSKDVIHSFKMPVMRFIHDANPGQNVKVWFQADKASFEAEKKAHEERRAKLQADIAAEQAPERKKELEAQLAKLKKNPEYEIICAQLCGIGHTRMRSVMEVMDQAEFDAWHNKGK